VRDRIKRWQIHWRFWIKSLWFRCRFCGLRGYGAGRCAKCRAMICYDHAMPVERAGIIWWNCPTCAEK
jgi:hypothetical protein